MESHEFEPQGRPKAVVFLSDAESDISHNETLTGLDAIVSEMNRRYPQMCQELNYILGEMYTLLLRKNHDYGTGNIAMGTALATEEDVQLALTGIVIRANDKIQRLINLVVKGHQPVNEAIEDSFIDLAIYGVIALLVSRGAWGK